MWLLYICRGFKLKTNNKMDKEEKCIIYSTDMINALVDFNSKGLFFDETPFYRRNVKLKSANLKFSFTEEEYREYNKCFSDPIYFIDNYCVHLSYDDNGKRMVTGGLLDFQKDIINDITKRNEDYHSGDIVNKNIIWTFARAIRQTSTVADILTWELIFRNDMKISIVTYLNGFGELCEKIKRNFENLPFFLKPGIVNMFYPGGHTTSKLIALSNGSILKLDTIDEIKNDIENYCADQLIVENFAYLHPGQDEMFWNYIYPNINVGQCILTSLQKRKGDVFNDIWNGAEKGENGFRRIFTPYNAIPEHDEEWMEKIKKQWYGIDDMQFSRFEQFCNEFCINSRFV